MSSLEESIVQPQFATTSIETTIKDKKQQHHQRSLPKKRMAAKVPLAAIRQWTVYKMSADLNVMILTGSDSNTGSSGKIANLMRNKKQIISHCVAALAYARIYLEESWKPVDIDKILDIGWNINRRAAMKRPMNAEHQTKIGNATDVFYIDAIKFVTLTEISTYPEKIFKNDILSINAFADVLKQMTKESCVVEYNKNYLSIWVTGEGYFIFHPTSANFRIPKCVHLLNFECLQKYLHKMFLDPVTECSFHSVQFLRINNQLVHREETVNRFFNEQISRFTGRTEPTPIESHLETNLNPHKICLMPFDDQSSENSSYERMSDVKDILRCENSVNRNSKIPSMCCAAIVVQYVKKSCTWTNDTLDDILALGTKIYKHNLKPEEPNQEARPTEVQISEIRQKIEFASFQCRIDVQLVIFGKVESSISSVCNLEQGLIEFFKSFIVGVIDGPNIVAVWNEGKYYYMYDPKARDRFGGKIRKVKGDDDKDSGMSCVTRFQELRNLVETYTGNIPLKERHEYYKITSVEVKPFLGKNWFEWKVISPGQYYLQGKSVVNLKSMFATSIMALLYAENIIAKEWTSNLIDEIVSIGNQNCADFILNVNSDLKELKRSIVFRDVKSVVRITPKVFRYVVSEVSKNIEDHLTQGFHLFFETNTKGIFSFNTPKNRKYFSIWKCSDNWYSFGYHVINNEGHQKEVLCVSRFKSHIELVKSLTANISIRKQQEYSLSRVNFYQEDQPFNQNQFKNYAPLQIENGFAGILHIDTNFDLIESCGSGSSIENVYYITSVLALSQIKDCWTWTSYDVCDILKLAQKSYVTLSGRFKELKHFYLKIGNTTVQLKIFQNHSGTFPTIQSISQSTIEVKISNDDKVIIISESDIEEDQNVIKEEPGVVEEHIGQALIGEETVTEEKVAEDPVTEETVTEETVAKEEETVAKEEETVVEETVAEETVVEETVVVETAEEETDVKKTAVEENPVEETVVEQKSVQEVAVEKTAVEETAVEETAVEITAVEETAAEETAVDETAVEETAVEVSAVDKTLLQETIVEERRADEETGTSYIAEGDVAEQNEIRLRPNVKQENDDNEKYNFEDEGNVKKQDEENEENLDEENEGNNSQEREKNQSLIETVESRHEIVLRNTIESLLSEFNASACESAVLNIKHMYYGIWKQDDSFFVFDPHCCDDEGLNKNQLDALQDKKKFCPYVAWFNSLKGLSEHIMSNVASAESMDYGFVYFQLKTKIEKNEVSKSWYNFSPINKSSNQWIIRALYGSLESKYGLFGCVIALAFASVLQPSDWNSKMLDNMLKYGKKLYNRSRDIESTKTELKLCDVVSPFSIGCYAFSFNSGLFICGANEHHFLNNGINNLFSNSVYGIISSKGYSVAIWKQNNSYFMFDPHIKRVACLSRFSDTKMISKNFLSHMNSGMTGVNVFEIYKVSISRVDSKRRECPLDFDALSKLLTKSTNNYINRDIGAVRMFGSVTGSSEWLEFKENSPTDCYVVAACLMCNYKSYEFWTSDTINEILRLGNKIFRSSIKKLSQEFIPTTVHLQPYQIQGMFPFDGQNSVYIRMELFKKAGSDSYKDIPLKVELKTSLIKFFDIWDNAFVRNEDATVTVWQNGGRFYLFYCQSIDEQGKLGKIGENEAALLTYNSLDELNEFLANNFVRTDYPDWFEIRHLDFTFVPTKADANKDKILLIQKQKEIVLGKKDQRLKGELCICSQTVEEHKQKIIIAQLNNHDVDQAHAAVRNLIILCMDTMSIDVQIPELNFDADWHITNTGFWENIESEIVRNEGVLPDMDVGFVEKIFTQSVYIGNIPQYWLKISVFLSDMALRDKDLLTYFAASASFAIISQLIKVRNAAAENDVQQSLTFCTSCIDRMMVLVAKENSIYKQMSFNLELEFLAIIQSKSILLTPNTMNIFKTNFMYEGLLALKTLEITHNFLKSEQEAVKRSIFEFYNEQENKWSLERVIVKSTVAEMKKAIQLTIDLVKYSKDNHIPFECNWVVILGHIFSSKPTIKSLSLKLLLTKFQNVTEYSVLEIALQIYRHTDDEIVEDIAFIDIFEPYENFKDTTKLFQLLRNSLHDFEKFKDIISVLRASVKKYNTDATEYVQSFSPVMSHMFEVIDLLQDKPEMLRYLITVVDIEKFMDDTRFATNFIALRATLTNLIVNHFHTYDVLLGLCGDLKKFSPPLEPIYKKIYNDCYIANVTSNDQDKIEATCTRFLAADVIFNFFERVEPNDRRKMCDAFKIWFGSNYNSRIKALLCSLIVNMLISFYATEIPSMSKVYIESEAKLYGQHVYDCLRENNADPLVKILFCTSFCRLYTSMQVLAIESTGLNKVYSILADCMKDKNLRKQNIYFVPIVFLWHELNELFSKRNHLTETPHSLVMLWNDMTNASVYNDHFIILIHRIWNYGDDHLFFADTMQKALYKINALNKSKQLVDKVFALMKDHHTLNDLESVASFIVTKMIQQAHDNPQVKMPFLEKIIEHLDRKYITSRLGVTSFLNRALIAIDNPEERGIMQKFLQYFTAKRNPPTSTKITTTRKRTTTTSNIATTSIPEEGESSSRIKRSKRSTIPSVNATNVTATL